MASTVIKKRKTKESVLEEEIVSMLDNPNPLTGIYSIYGDYPIEDDERKAPLF
jgi:hypothetical protein